MQESMGEFEFNEEQYQQRLERTLKLFQRARAMQSIEQAERLARDIAEQQERLQQQTSELDNAATGNNPERSSNGLSDADEPTPDVDRVAAEQERTAQEAERLEEMLEEIQRQLDELGSGDRSSLERLREETRREQIPERIDRKSVV